MVAASRGNRDAWVAEAVSAGPIGETTVVWCPGDVENVCMYHQFGAVTTANGTVLVFAERRVAEEDSGNPHHICEKRSLDGSKTWSETIIAVNALGNKCTEMENEANGITGHCYANPTPVVNEATGRIFLFYAENFDNESSRLYYKYSDDEGMTWSSACEVTSLFESDPYVRPFHLPGPGHGIQLQNWGGRLIVTVWHRLSYSLGLDRDQYQYGLSTLFSDDGGETWTNSEYMALENNLNPGHGIQLWNWGGRLIVTVWHRLSYSLDLDRDQYQYGLSTLFSDDGGETWTNSEYMALENNLNEGRIAEIPNGDLVMNARSFDQHRYRVVSVDGRASWSDSTLWENIVQYGDCDSGFYSKLKTGYTRLFTSHIASETTVRNSLWVYLCYDEGKTWAYGKELWNGSNLT